MITALRFFFFFVVSAYSFECYHCIDETSEKCNEKQTKVNCTGNDKKCIKVDGYARDWKTFEMRLCTNKCAEAEEICTDDSDAIFEDEKMMKCRFACCVPDDGDLTPCYSALKLSLQIWS